MKFEQEPNYNYLRNIFIKILEQMNYNYKTLNFGWIKNDNNKKLIRGSKAKTPQVSIIKSLNKFGKAEIKKGNNIATKKDYISYIKLKKKGKNNINIKPNIKNNTIINDTINQYKHDTSRNNCNPIIPKNINPYSTNKQKLSNIKPIQDKKEPPLIQKFKSFFQVFIRSSTCIKYKSSLVESTYNNGNSIKPIYNISNIFP
jgi:hypothetical protein